MSGIERICGIAAPLLRINVDTDAIIPSREMRRVSKQGLAGGLFANWRYSDPASRQENPDFILNQSPYDEATILLAGRNFGCGSSREHAVWALAEWGIKAIVAPSFGSIFATNCLNNGLIPVRLRDEVIRELAEAALEAPRNNQLVIDIRDRRISAGTRWWPLDIGDREREMLLRGLSPIGMTLEHEDLIREFEALDATLRPWAVR